MVNLYAYEKDYYYRIRILFLICCLLFGKKRTPSASLEKNDSLGGRARQFKKDGFTFDMGPSWYWMPDVFESFFNDFGKQVSDYYTLDRLSPGYQVVFGKDDVFPVEDSIAKIAARFDEIEAGSGVQTNTIFRKSTKQLRHSR
jgi:phytoene desaturase